MVQPTQQATVQGETLPQKNKVNESLGTAPVIDPTPLSTYLHVHIHEHSLLPLSLSLSICLSFLFSLSLSHTHSQGLGGQKYLQRLVL